MSKQSQHVLIALPHPLLHLVSLGLVSFIFTLFSLELSQFGTQLAPLWFPTSIMMVAFYRHAGRMWPGIALSCSLGNIAASILLFSTSSLNMTWTTINIVEAVVGAVLLRKLLPWYNPLQKLADWLRLAFGSAIVPPLLGGVLVVLLTPGDDPLRAFLIWVLSESIGALALVPLGLLFKPHYLLRHRNPRLLFESLLRALKLSCRLIMVGDSDQLPSVGAGNILKDMIDSGRLTVVALNEIFRQAQQSCIITNAHKIVNGEEPDLSRKDSDFFFMQRLDAEGAAVTVTELCSRRLPDAYGYSPLDDIQVLCPSRKGILGSVEMNKMLQRVLNPPKKELSEVKGILFTFRDGDKVMQTKNNYDIVWKKDGENGTGIFNGDIGTIVKVKRGEGTVVIDFEGRIAEYSLEMLEQLELAYAITVHKSQGSEFTAVIIPLLGGFDKLYYRNLLYTAVTRAKKMLIIVGSKSIVEKMVHNDRRTLRYTCLRHMIESELG